ncbi:hypothetical protein Tco_0915902, partial [Tanacetum coccineum]
GDDPAEGSRRQYVDRCALYRRPDNGHGLKGQQRGHIPDVGRVLAGQGRDAISINEPRGTIDDRMSQLLTQLEVGGGSWSGRGMDDEPGADEDAGGDEEI